MTWRDVFVEVPIKVHNNSLTQALIADINPAAGATAADLERLNLGSAPYISKTMTGLIDCLDDLVAEQQKVRGQEIYAERRQGRGWLGCLRCCDGGWEQSVSKRLCDKIEMLHIAGWPCSVVLQRWLQDVLTATAAWRTAAASCHRKRQLHNCILYSVLLSCPLNFVRIAVCCCCRCPHLCSGVHVPPQHGAPAAADGCVAAEAQAGEHGTPCSW